ncbi:MAG TPA: hypothetical protein VIK78_03350 [Ruminiclostridium sp.]
MKKLFVILTPILLIGSLAISVLASNGNKIGSEVPSKETIENAPNTITTGIIDSSINISAAEDSIEEILKNPNFKNHGYLAKQITQSVALNKMDTIAAVKNIQGESELKFAKKVTSVLVNFTDTETPQLPSEIVLKDYPVWIVTLHGINVKTRFGTILADKNVIIDANSGEEIESFSYPSVE